jgi:prepilin-type N-terminal cleavage/methylation domain-containing protein
VRYRRRSYTLLEVILVLALLAILAALSYPSIDAMFSGYRLTAAADAIRAGWASARSHAIDEGRPYRFAVVQGKGNFRIAPDLPDYWGGNAAAPPDASTPELVLEEILPKGVRLGTPDFTRNGLDQDGESALPLGSIEPGQWAPVVSFLPDGTASDDVQLTLQAHGSRPVVVQLRALTGVVRVRFWEGGVP